MAVSAEVFMRERGGTLSLFFPRYKPQRIIQPEGLGALPKPFDYCFKTRMKSVFPASC